MVSVVGLCCSSIVRQSENENEVLRLHTNLLKIFHDADSSHKGKLKYNEFVKIMQRWVRHTRRHEPHAAAASGRGWRSRRSRVMARLGLRSLC